jgi:hypothetical protein
MRVFIILRLKKWLSTKSTKLVLLFYIRIIVHCNGIGQRLLYLHMYVGTKDNKCDKISIRNLEDKLVHNWADVECRMIKLSKSRNKLKSAHLVKKTHIDRLKCQFYVLKTFLRVLHFDHFLIKKKLRLLNNVGRRKCSKPADFFSCTKMLLSQLHFLQS